ncbi:MAG: 30S ribosomal protein S6 [Clostridia bacterium]
MNKYELLFIISSSTTEEVRETLIEKFKSFIESKAGVIEGVDKWGMKKFAYPINFKTEGFYVLINFSSAPEVIAELDKKMSLSEDIVRQMFVKKSK